MIAPASPPPPLAGLGREADQSRGEGPALLLLDNYDSFTFNLYHRLGELGARVDVRRNDALTPEEAEAGRPDAVVVSPGPCDPDRAGISLALIARMALLCPVLGVCLGHQAIGQAFGGRVVRAPAPMHGKVSLVHHDGTGVFAGLPSPFPATRYHSLVVARDSLPAALRVNAWTGDGLVMGLRHESLPVHGVQFHPESIETETGYDLLRNFLALVPDGTLS
ncbi:MAG: aminodeoxychorismate/anthranilate synthase component II [Acetobacteraceae bacterium]|nr:aminodeoxychorismate/anthranilate synthase component II [Acetobacteraceae bacterium]